MPRITPIVFPILTISLAASQASAQPSNGLDPTFGNAGTLVISEVNPQGEMAVGFQTNGDIVVAGDTAVPGLGAFLLRLLPSGAFDPSFAGNGLEFIPLGVSSIAVLPNNQILVAGVTSAGVAVVERFDANGSLDTSFGTGGSAAPSVGSYVILVDPKGNIIVGGGVSVPPPPGSKFYTEAFALARLLPNGAPDPTFGPGGTVTTTTKGSVSGLALETDGSILALDSLEGITVLRFSSTGAPETLAVNGSISQVSVGDGAEWATFAPNGDILAAGGAPGIGKDGRYGEILQYSLAGVLNPNFGTVFNWGIAAPDVKSTPAAIALEPNGIIVAGGTATTSTAGTYDFGFGVFNPDGTPDTAFASGGLTNTDIVDDDEIYTVAIQPNGAALAVGSETLSNNGQGQLLLARYLVP